MPRAADQIPLFDQARSFPNGLIYRPDFITPAEEATLLEDLAALPLAHARTGEYIAKRRLKNFGWSFDYEKGRLLPGPPLPPFLSRYQRKIAKWLDIPAASVVEALVNEYALGSGLGWHRDNETFETIIGISLGSWARMRFRPLAHAREGNPRKKDEILTLELEPRSVYVMQRDIRWQYQHRVMPTKGLRYSITFRTLPKGILPATA